MIMHRQRDPLAGGLSRRGKRCRYPKSQLRMGQRVEMEHTKYPTVARKIAKDHLCEDRRYYTKLKKMERHSGRR